MKRILPYPILAAFLLAAWLMLGRTASAGQVVLGALVAVAATWALAVLRPERARIRRLGALMRFAGLVAYDITRSAIAVGRIVLRSREPGVNAGFMRIRLDMRSRHGLAVLACVITSTPGTIWVSYDGAKGELLLHVLDLIDETVWVEIIKHRYERLLMEVFE